MKIITYFEHYIIQMKACFEQLLLTFIIQYKKTLLIELNNKIIGNGKRNTDKTKEVT